MEEHGWTSCFLESFATVSQAMVEFQGRRMWRTGRGGVWKVGRTALLQMYRLSTKAATYGNGYKRKRERFVQYRIWYSSMQHSGVLSVYQSLQFHATTTQVSTQWRSQREGARGHAPRTFGNVFFLQLIYVATFF